MTQTLQALGSTISKLRALLQETQKDLSRIQTLQTSLTETLDGLFDTAAEVDPPAVVLAADGPLWKETLSLIGTSRVPGIAAQAEDVLSARSSNVRETTWVADGKAYARWMATGVTVLNERGHQAAASQLLGKGLGLGYSGVLVEGVTDALMRDANQKTNYYSLVKRLSSWEQRHFLTALLGYLETRILAKATATPTGSANSTSAKDKDVSLDKRIAGATALLQGLLADNSYLNNELCEVLLNRPLEVTTVRACIAALPTEKLRSLMERSWNQFGDKLQIKHKPIAQQESNVRLLLLIVGRVHVSYPMDVFVMARSSHHGNAISERLKSSSGRVRWLGMIVGIAISALIDKGEQKLRFDVEEMKTEEAKWCLGLVSVRDQMGAVSDLFEGLQVQKATTGGATSTKTANKQAKPPIASTTKSKIIEIVSDDEEDDLQPYSKPDDDPSDSEEDATLVDRSKPKAPVYIRDLLTMLNDNDDHNRQKLALETASSLIRRKADFGSELKDQAEDMTATLIGLHDNFDMEDWDQLRQQTLIALIVAQPKVVGPLLARSFFMGDYSVSQRAVILTSTGIAGRELAGYGADDTALIKRSQEQDLNAKLFPSKRLPDRLHRVYGGDELDIGQNAHKQITASMNTSNAVDTISRHLSTTLLQPVTTRKTARTQPRTRPLRNDLASLVGTCFFFPLAGGYATFSSSYVPTTSARSSITDPTLLSLLVKTLALLLSAAGRASTALPQMCTELWSLLLSIRTKAMKHAPLMEAVLFAALTVLDTGSDAGASAGGRMLVDGLGKGMSEMREWVGIVWEKLEEDSESEEVERSRYLAAGVLVRMKELLKGYQKAILGGLG